MSRSQDRDELRSHLVAVARIATRLGLKPDELTEQLLEIHSETAGDSK